MKKLILALPLFSLMFFSCEKEVRPNTTSPSNPSKAIPTPAALIASTASYTWFDYRGNREGIDYGCDGDPMDCAETYVCTPAMSEIIGDLGSASPGDGQGTVVSSNYEDLEKIIDPELLDNIMLGDNYVVLRGTISSTSTGYLVVKDGTSVKFVYPLTK